MPTREGAISKADVCFDSAERAFGWNSFAVLLLLPRTEGFRIADGYSTGEIRT
jgi:hypothetical protein